MELDVVDVADAGKVLLVVEAPKIDPVEIVEDVDPKLQLLVKSATFEVRVEAVVDKS